MVRDAPVAGLEPIYPTVSRRNADAPADVRTDSESSTVRGEQRALATRGTTSCVCNRPRAKRAAPEGIGALKRQEGLWYVCLGEYYGARGAQRSDGLSCKVMVQM
jgi:hypothetical protein